MRTARQPHDDLNDSEFALTLTSGKLGDEGTDVKAAQLEQCPSLRVSC
jgi:hypothetical protein